VVMTDNDLESLLVHALGVRPLPRAVILAAQSGRTLDYFVATEVIGFEVKSIGAVFDPDDRPIGPNDPDFCEAFADWSEWPHYSANVAATFDAVSRYRRVRKACHIALHSEGAGWVASVICPRAAMSLPNAERIGNVHRTGGVIDVHGETPSEALSRAMVVGMMDDSPRTRKAAGGD
jgi:hypothetical protein